MTWKRQVKVLHTRDGEPTYQSIRDVFADIPEVEVDNDLGTLPATHQPAVGVVILTDDALADGHVSHGVDKLIGKKLSILPVVEDLGAYDFSRIPDSLESLRELNALGWREADRDGEQVVITIKRYIGLTPFKNHCKVFISYCRSDGGDVAMEVYSFLLRKGYWTFLDTESVDGGEDIQEVIKKAISDRDLILLIDSPGAAESKWVKKGSTAKLTFFSA